MPITEWFQRIAFLAELAGAVLFMAAGARRLSEGVDKHGSMALGVRERNAGVLFVTGLVLIGYLVWHGDLWFHPVYGPLMRTTSGLTVLIPSGWLLARFKSRKRRYYGYLELSVAFVVGVLSLLRVGNYGEAFDLIGICSSLYLFVRAFDNINEGRKEEAKREVQTSEPSR